jgi:hypothetical protein
MNPNLQTPPNPSAKPNQNTSLASHLESLSTAGIHAVNARDWTYTNPLMRESLLHLAPDFEAQHDNFPAKLSFQENMDSSRFLAEQNQNFHLEILSVSTNVSESGTAASVWIEMCVEGIGGEGVRMRGFSELKWRFCGEDGRWYCYRHLGMRGGLV